MIYEFLWMTEEDLVSSSHRYTHLVQADIKSFYPSIYTHSLAWAIHGKRHIRKGNNRHDYTLLGNRLDRLFQYSNDQRTNGIPIGPVVSDIVAGNSGSSRRSRVDQVRCVDRPGLRDDPI